MKQQFINEEHYHYYISGYNNIIVNVCKNNHLYGIITDGITDESSRNGPDMQYNN